MQATFIAAITLIVIGGIAIITGILWYRIYMKLSELLSYNRESDLKKEEANRELLKVLNHQNKIIMQYQQGIFNKQQAKNFTNVYINYIIAELHEKVNEIAINYHKLDKNEAKPIEAIFDKYINKVKRSMYLIREQTSSFLLVNEIDYKHFIEGVDEKFEHLIQEGQINLYEKFLEFMSKKEKLPPSLDQLSNYAHKEIDIIGKKVKKIVYKELDSLYEVKKLK